jgi:hypothetical protein
MHTPARSFVRALVASAAVAALALPAMAGPDVEEGSRDAGATPQTAKQAKGNATLVSLSGATAEAYLVGDVVDMFLIYVSNPATFSITTDASTTFNPMLWLFKVSADSSGNYSGGLALLANDNMNSTTTAAKLYFPVGTQWTAGVYAVAITASGVKPFGLVPPTTGGGFNQVALFNTGLPTDLLGPSQAGFTVPVKLWNGAAGSGSGSYRMSVTGCTLIPPGSGTAVCGDVFSGDCFVPHATTRGCTDPTCCAIVCGLDALCCTTSWDDLCATLAQQNCPQCTAPVNTCPADLNGDGVVNGGDLSVLLAAWGVCP